MKYLILVVLFLYGCQSPKKEFTEKELCTIFVKSALEKGSFWEEPELSKSSKDFLKDLREKKDSNVNWVYAYINRRFILSHLFEMLEDETPWVYYFDTGVYHSYSGIAQLNARAKTDKVKNVAYELILLFIGPRYHNSKLGYLKKRNLLVEWYKHHKDHTIEEMRTSLEKDEKLYQSYYEKHEIPIVKNKKDLMEEWVVFDLCRQVLGPNDKPKDLFKLMKNAYGKNK